MPYKHTAAARTMKAVAMLHVRKTGPEVGTTDEAADVDEPEPEDDDELELELFPVGLVVAYAQLALVLVYVATRPGAFMTLQASWTSLRSLTVLSV